MGGMGGMMRGGHVPNLKSLDPEDRVQTITYCKDTYNSHHRGWSDTQVLGA